MAKIGFINFGCAARLSVGLTGAAQAAGHGGGQVRLASVYSGGRTANGETASASRLTAALHFRNAIGEPRPGDRQSDTETQRGRIPHHPMRIILVLGCALIPLKIGNDFTLGTGTRLLAALLRPLRGARPEAGHAAQI